MPKVRKPKAANKLPTSDEVEAFAAGAETTMQVEQTTDPAVDPTAPRNFKALKLGLNEYEYQILEDASRRAGRSKLNFIRHAMLTMAKEVDSK